MDTHITDRAEIQVEEAEEILSHPLPDAGTDRLDGFGTVEKGERLAPQTPPAAVRKPRRNGLMVTVCCVGVLAVASGVFWISPYNHYSIADASRVASQARDAALNEMPRLSAPAPLAPAARLARAPEPTHLIAPYRAPAPVSMASQHGDDMAEFLKLGGQGAPTPLPEPDRKVASAPAAASRTPVPVAQTTPVAPVVAASPQAQQSGATAVAPDPLKQIDEAARSSAPTPTRPQADAVAAIAALRPAPMTEPQQVQVLDLVAQLGTLVRDQRAEIAQLRQDQEHVSQHVDVALADFGRRISLAEARRAVSAAGQAEASAVQPAGAASGSSGTGVTPVVARNPLPAAPPAGTGPHRYHVQAASPGLAMLSELDPSGGEERQLPVSPGDDVPGWGKVVSISQRGTTWTVKTDHGLIQ